MAILVREKCEGYQICLMKYEILMKVKSYKIINNIVNSLSLSDAFSCVWEFALPLKLDRMNEKYFVEEKKNVLEYMYIFL